MKKFVTVLCVNALLLSVSGCSKSTKDQQAQEDPKDLIIGKWAAKEKDAKTGSDITYTAEFTKDGDAKISFPNNLITGKYKWTSKDIIEIRSTCFGKDQVDQSKVSVTKSELTMSILGKDVKFKRA